MSQGKKKLDYKSAPNFVKANQAKRHKILQKKSKKKCIKKMKFKTFSDKLNNEIEKNIRMNIEEEMKVRAGKASKNAKK